MTLPKPFKIRLDPSAMGSEHRNAYLAQADGRTISVVEEVRPDLYLTDFRLEGDPPDSDYVHKGYLLIMPSKDGRWVSRPTRRASA